MSFPKQIKDIVYQLLQEPTLDHFREFIRGQTGEHNSIDFKEQWLEKGKLAKIILAIANSGGGIVVFGVHENEDHSFTCYGLDEFRDKAVISNELKKYISPEIKYEVYDFSYSSSEYSELEGKRFQILVVDDTPEFIPFVSQKEGEDIKENTIYVRRGTMCEAANGVEIQAIVSRRVNYEFPHNGQPLVYFLCNPKWYKELFKPAMDYAYPQGCEEARVYLTRLIPIRNALSHANPISIRQAEQAICYTHDFIDGIKQFYKDRGEDRMWNVPKIIRATDSRGKEMFPPSETTSQFNVIIQPEYEVGDTYSVQIEVDSSFPPDSYSIRWSIRGKEITEYKNQKHFSITFSTAEIGQVLIVNCKLITTREWHRYYDCDDEMNLLFTVLPPTL